MKLKHPECSVCYISWVIMAVAVICLIIAYNLQGDRLDSVTSSLVDEIHEKNNIIDAQKVTIQLLRDRLGMQIYDATKIKRTEFLNSEVSCLAENIYREAAGEPENGQLAVATVTMNRVADPTYPKTVCGVVYERHIKKDSDTIVCMFSWVCQPKKRMQSSVYKHILLMARSVYFKHARNEDVADATLYHAVYVYPDWADPSNLIATIGLHMFYR